MNRSLHPHSALLGIALAMSVGPVLAADGELALTFVDSQTGQPIPVRVEFMNARGKTVRLRGVGVGKLGEHFYLPGQVTLPLRRGGYRFLLDAGPEYRTQRGHFEIERHADDAKQVELRRFANLSKEGWWAGDLDAERGGDELPIIAATEGIHYAPTTAFRYDGTTWKKTDAAVHRSTKKNDPFVAGRELGSRAARIEWTGGDLLVVDGSALGQPPIEIGERATSVQILSAVDKAKFHVVALSPTAWELPVWIASGKLDAVALLAQQSEWKKVNDGDPNGRPRDRSFYPGPQGLARWGEAIYFQWLNAGVRLPVVAGSGSGVNESPLGTNRAYVYVEGEFSAETWWRGVKEGAVVVTNGPLLRPQVGGAPPGQTFRLEMGESIDFQIALNLASRETVEYLEILKNGEVAAEVRLADWAASGGRLPPVTFDASGWFAIRAVTENRDKYQLALSAPYYVESPEGPRVSRASVKFFLTWLDELESRADELESLTEDDLAMARAFWTGQLEKANAP